MPEWHATLGQAESDRGRTALELLSEAGYDLPAVCGGGGRCGKCLVRVTDEALSPPSGEERDLLHADRLGEGWRLACQTRVHGPITVTWEGPAVVVPGKGLASTTRPLPLAPAVTRRRARLAAPSLKDPQGDWERLAAGLGVSGPPDPWACAGLAGLDRTRDELDLVFGHGTLLGLAPTGRLLGAAFDLGTTTVLGALADLEDGHLLAVRSAFNAQRAFGADVLARLGRACDPEGSRALRERIQGQVRAMLHALLAEAGYRAENLVDLVAVGNTAMEHLFFGFDVSGLATLPFVPVHQAGLALPLATLGLPCHPGARLYFPPNLAGFIGADTVAGLVATDLARQPGPVLLMDLGTNGELVLSHDGRLWACSTAAGPAFEGDEISCGLTGHAGAIDRVTLDGDLHLGTIGDEPPRGICGSGLIDAVAALRRAGAIDATGRVLAGDGLSPPLAARLRPGAHGFDVLLAAARVRDLLLTQGDVRQIQLAKGAIAAGVRLLCEAAGLRPADVCRVLLAGVFGQHVTVENAAALGLFPGIPPERVRAVGNVAGEGALLMLTNAGCRAEAEEIARRVRVVELAAEPNFQEVFAEEMMFPET